MDVWPDMSHSSRTATARGLLALLCVALLCPLVAYSQAALPAKLRAAILLRALQYEKTFSASSDPAVLVVLGGTKGKPDGAEMVEAIRSIAAAATSNRKIVVKELSGGVTADALRALKPQVVYVALGDEGAMAVAASVPLALVLCGEPKLVGSGCLMSVEAAGNSSRLVIDLAAAEKSGRTFDAKLLRLSRVIR